MSLFGLLKKKGRAENSNQGDMPNANASRTSRSKIKISNWYSDRYLAIAIQRNVLFLFSLLASIGVLVGLMLVKVMYDQRSIDPYLIEIEPDTGIATVVDYKTKKEYTAQESLKESLLVKYVMARESYNVHELEKNGDLVRVFSTKEIYDAFVKAFEESVRPIKQYGQQPEAKIKIRSVNYIAPTRVNLRFSKIVSAADKSEAREYKYLAIITFGFSDLSLNMEDMWTNPFGFQVNSYVTQVESVDE